MLTRPHGCLQFNLFKDWEQAKKQASQVLGVAQAKAYETVEEVSTSTGPAGTTLMQRSPGGLRVCWNGDAASCCARQAMRAGQTQRLPIWRAPVWDGWLAIVQSFTKRLVTRWEEIVASDWQSLAEAAQKVRMQALC